MTMARTVTVLFALFLGLFLGWLPVASGWGDEAPVAGGAAVAEDPDPIPRPKGPASMSPAEIDGAIDRGRRDRLPPRLSGGNDGDVRPGAHRGG
jgi:hypothetical protein